MSRAMVQTAPLPLAPTLAWPSARPPPLAAYHGTRLSSIRAPGPGSGVCQSAAPRRRSQASKQEAVPERPEGEDHAVARVLGLGRVGRRALLRAAGTDPPDRLAGLRAHEEQLDRGPARSAVDDADEIAGDLEVRRGRPVQPRLRPPERAPGARRRTPARPRRRRARRRAPRRAPGTGDSSRGSRRTGSPSTATAPVASARASSRSRNATSTRSPSSQRRTRPASGPVTPSSATIPARLVRRRQPDPREVHARRRPAAARPSGPPRRPAARSPGSGRRRRRRAGGPRPARRGRRRRGAPGAPAPGRASGRARTPRRAARRIGRPIATAIAATIPGRETGGAAGRGVARAPEPPVLMRITRIARRRPARRAAGDVSPSSARNSADRGVDRPGLLQLGEVPGARDLHEARARNRLREEPAVPERCEPVLGAGQDERGRPDRGEALPDVEPVAGEVVAERHERRRPRAGRGRPARRTPSGAAAPNERSWMRLCPSRGCWRRRSTIRVSTRSRAPVPIRISPARRSPAARARGSGRRRRPSSARRGRPARPPASSRKRVEPLRVRGDARLAAAAERPVTRQIGRHDPRDAGEPVELRLPELRGSAGAVNQDERRA